MMDTNGEPLFNSKYLGLGIFIDGVSTVVLDGTEPEVTGVKDVIIRARK